ncbi:hypothetical protein [Asticcacaulis sp. AC402]|uniref:hypothetical protein n=1 Tax=Asticcacaulis sp. AC402 TaxID=1282361 RepID=UPI0003C404B8|nr:hypothetical protein [Asticcacaulis sp. AC402]ESQ73914.1 hypothetical protein ABAC402_16835 [Asticcacaulis sp. AC402]
MKLSSVVKAAIQMEFDAHALAELTGFLNCVIGMDKFGEINLLSATDDLDLRVMAAEAHSPDLMQFIYVGPEAFGCIPMENLNQGWTRTDTDFQHLPACEDLERDGFR